MLDKRPIATAKLLLEMAQKLLQDEYDSLDAQYPDTGDRSWRHNDGFPDFAHLSDACEYNLVTLEELEGLL